MKATNPAVEVTRMQFLPTVDGGAVLTLDGVRHLLTIDQTNALLRGLLSAATIKIESEDA